MSLQYSLKKQIRFQALCSLTWSHTNYFHLPYNVQVYYEVKEAISTLSPIIRNRLRGLPAYVLDYSDLIPPNLVEKPWLKPVSKEKH